MSDEKIYVGAAKEFGSYGDLKVSINVNDMDGNLRVKPNDKGWINLIVSKRREPDKRGNTHSVRLDTWKPTHTDAPAGRQPGEDDLPF